MRSRHLIWGGMLFGITQVTSVSVLAKSREAENLNSDIRQERRENLKVRSKPAIAAVHALATSGWRSAEWSIDVSAPISFTDNAEVAHMGGHDTWHSDPGVDIGWSAKFAEVKISAKLSADTDRYLSHSKENDSDTVKTQMKLEFNANDTVVPYVLYKSTLLFAPTFSNRSEAFNDFSAGVVASGGNVALDLSGGKRLADKGLDSWFVRLSSMLIHECGDEFSLVFNPTVQRRVYGHSGRKDINVSVIVSGAYTPAWINAGFLSGGEIDFSYNFTRNLSNKRLSRFTQNDAGPSVGFQWKF